MPSQPDLDRLRSIKTLPSLIAYLRDELDWPIEADETEDVTFDYDPEELGFDKADAVHIKEIKQLRPLDAKQPWGIFWVNLEKKRLPVVMLRRILANLVLKKRAAANKASQRAWHLNDLLFISAYGEETDRAITFAHFSQDMESPYELRVWTTEEELLVGTGPDHEIATRLKRTFGSVYGKRRLLGIPPAPWWPQKWTKRQLKLLGKKPDQVVARLTGRSLDATSQQRILGQIPCRGRKQRRWTAAQDRLLGTKPDKVLARRWNRSIPAIKTRKSLLGIKRRVTVIRYWKQAELALLRSHSTKEAARLLRRTPLSVSAARVRYRIHDPIHPRFRKAPAAHKLRPGG